jgi:hypothetical protein
MNGYSFLQVLNFSILDLWSRLVGVLPELVGAFLVVLIGLIAAPILGGIAKRVIDVFRIDDLAKKVGVHDMLKGYTKKFSISLLIGKLVKWFFILVAIMAAADLLGWSTVTEFLNDIILYIPQVIIAIVILVFGVIAGNFFDVVVTKSLQGSNAPVSSPEVLGNITKWALILFAALAALIQLGIAPSLIQILFAGIVLALSLAFGLGGRDHASKLLEYMSGSKK